MRIKKIEIKEDVKYKILYKYKVRFSEITQSILSENNFVRKTKEGRYIAVAKEQRYLTIFLSISKIIVKYLCSLATAIYLPSLVFLTNLFSDKIDCVISLNLTLCL